MWMLVDGTWLKAKREKIQWKSFSRKGKWKNGRREKQTNKKEKQWPCKMHRQRWMSSGIFSPFIKPKPNTKEKSALLWGLNLPGLRQAQRWDNTDIPRWFPWEPEAGTVGQLALELLSHHPLSCWEFCTKPNSHENTFTPRKFSSFPSKRRCVLDCIWPKRTTYRGESPLNFLSNNICTLEY